MSESVAKEKKVIAISMRVTPEVLKEFDDLTATLGARLSGVKLSRGMALEAMVRELKRRIDEDAQQS